MSTRKDAFDVGQPNEGKDKIFNDEVKRVCKMGIPTPATMIELYNKYPNNERLVDEVLRACTKKYARILKKATKVAEKVKARYESGSRPIHEILDKMIKYKNDNDWSDAQYAVFTDKLREILSGKQADEFANNQQLVIHRSRINRALGHGRRQVDEGTLKIKESEYPVLAEILSLFESSRTLYNSSMNTSLRYSDLDPLAMTGEFNKGKHIASNHIHPLFACMFLPKFELFEYHMIYADIGRIIKARKEGKDVLIEPDAYLYQDMSVDPNDVVCDTESAITDLRNRYKVQIKLWKTVELLRSGLYYESEAVRELISSLNMCRNNLFDNADLVYNQDEGAILRRLMSVFSLRPIWVSVTPIANLPGYGQNPMMGFGFGQGYGQGLQGYGQNQMGFSNQPMATITTLPFITVQLTSGDEPVDLESGLSSYLWLTEKGNVTPKIQNIIHTREICIFYVNRRTQRTQIRTFANPLSFSQLPLTMSSSSKADTHPLNVNSEFRLKQGKGEPYQLRSVVAITDTKIEPFRQGGVGREFYITGCVGLLMKHMDVTNGLYNDEYFRYDPVGASIPRPLPNTSPTEYVLNKPIHRIPATALDNLEEDADDTNRGGFFDIARSRGTIFIYAKPSGYSRENVELVL